MKVISIQLDIKPYFAIYYIIIEYFPHINSNRMYQFKLCNVGKSLFLGTPYPIRSSENDLKLYYHGPWSDLELFDVGTDVTVVPSHSNPWVEGKDFVCQGRVGLKAFGTEPTYNVSLVLLR